jgi:hypothetical protein
MVLGLEPYWGFDDQGMNTMGWLGVNDLWLCNWFCNSV